MAESPPPSVRQLRLGDHAHHAHDRLSGGDLPEQGGDEARRRAVREERRLDMRMAHVVEGLLDVKADDKHRQVPLRGPGEHVAQGLGQLVRLAAGGEP